MTLIVAVLFSCALASGQTPSTPKPVTTQPAATQPSPTETIAAARSRLVPPPKPPPPKPRRARRVRGKPAPEPPAEPPPEPAKMLTDDEIALIAAFDLTIAIGRADGSRAEDLIDAVGYQPLPLKGELPEDPAKPTPRAKIVAYVQASPPSHLDELPAAGFRAVDQKALRALFPAAAEWMLPEDRAVVIEPAANQPNWVKQRCCLIVRLRARKPSIIGGNLLEALRGP
jgi:hypothetical protein